MNYTVIDFNNQRVGEIDLNSNVFSSPLRSDILHQVVRWQLAKRRSGNHQTKGVSQISGTTRKPWRQKGTGRARAGSLRSPQFRGGGIIFGPQTRDHSFCLNKKIRMLGLKIALSEQVRKKSLRLLNNLDLENWKTQRFVENLKNLEVESALILLDGTNVNLERAAKNIKKILVLPVSAVNVFDLLKYQNVICTVDALKKIEERLQ